jgi:hypothetical protein
MHLLSLFLLQLHLELMSLSKITAMLKNKYIFRILTVIILSLTVPSCEKALEPQVYSIFTDMNFPKTEADIKAFTTSFYCQFTAGWGTSNPTGGFLWGVYSSMNGWFQIGNATTDEMVDTWNPTYKFEWGSAFDTYTGLYCKTSYVAKATGFLDVLQKASIPESLRKSAIAEVKCLRAWIMFLLYDFYGPVAVRLDPTKLEEKTFSPRPSKTEYFNAMVSDLTAAIPDLLPKTNNTQDWGRVNKGVATMLLMKLYMNDGQYEDRKSVV